MGNKVGRGSKDSRWLDLTDKKLKQIPPQLAQLDPKGLCLSVNNVSLNDDIGNIIPSVEYLELSNCNLLSLPKAIINLKNLKELNLSRNSLSVLPPLPESLEKLDVSYNMIVNIPEQFSQLPNLYFLNLEGNPGEREKKVLSLKGRTKVSKFLDREIHMDKLLRFNANDIEELTLAFKALIKSPEEHLVEKSSFMRRFGMEGVINSLFVDSLFRVFVKYSTEKEVMDSRAFLMGLGVIFKGTVDEKMNFAFQIFDLDSDGAISLKEVRKVVKSSLVSAMYLAERSRQEFESDENVKVKTKEYEVELQYEGKPIVEVRTEISNPEFMGTHVQTIHWPFVKEIITKIFKEMDKSGKGKVSFKDFSRYWFTKFPDISDFLHFYGSILVNGPNLKQNPSTTNSTSSPVTSPPNSPPVTSPVASPEVERKGSS